MALDFPLRRNEAAASDQQVALYRREPEFARYYSDHMAKAVWTVGEGWREHGIVPYAPFVIDPACGVLHYAQEIFEGLKAFRHPDNSVCLFRPERNALRFENSARRMGMAVLPAEDFVTSVVNHVRADSRWVPEGPDKAFYLRPFMFASENFLGVRASNEYTYVVIGTPVGSYFPQGVKPVNIWLTQEYTRAAPGGTGAAKCGGNYAASVLATNEAKAHGCSQVMFVDAVEHKWIEELGGMNVFIVTKDHELLTPELTGTILEGVTRESVLVLAREMGLTVIERRLSVDEVLEGIQSKTFTELFACGTAASVTPIGLFRTPDRGDVAICTEPGEVTMKIRNKLLGIQYGTEEDTHNWLVKVTD